MAKDKSEKKERKEKAPKTPKSSSKGEVEAATPATEPATSAAAAARAHVSVIARPLASEKLTKKVLKLTKSAARRRAIRRGVKEVVKAIRKKTKGVVLIAGDVSPIDVITALPVLCEDADIPYIYVPSREELGAAGLTKRPTSCVLLLPTPGKAPAGAAPAADEDDGADFSAAFSDVVAQVKAAQEIF